MILKLVYDLLDPDSEGAKRGVGTCLNRVRTNTLVLIDFIAN